MQRIRAFGTPSAVIAAAVLFFSVTASAQTAPPYFENFETLATCPLGVTSVCNISGVGWTNLPAGTISGAGLMDSHDWQVDVGGTSSSNTGPSVDHTLGTSTGKYLYRETSGSVNGLFSIARSPVFDATGQMAPRIRFWYHMFGATQGQFSVDLLEIFNVQADAVVGGNTLVSGLSNFVAGHVGTQIVISGSAMGNDGTYVITNVTGPTSVDVTPAFPNAEGPINMSHTAFTADITPSFTDNQNLWQEKLVDVSAWLVRGGSVEHFQIDLRYAGSTSFTGDAAFDDFTYEEGFGSDVAVLSVDAPVGSGFAGAPNTVTCTIRNLGAMVESNIPVGFQLDGGGFNVIEIFAGPINPLQTMQFTFASAAVVAATGPHTIDVAVFHGDPNPANDQASGMFTALPSADVGVVSVDSPIGVTGVAGGPNTVTCTVQNLGANPESNIPIGFQVDGGGFNVVEVVPGPINPGQSAQFTFAGAAVVGLPGNHTIDVAVFSGDANPANDQASGNFFARDFVAAFPYVQDFETTNDWSSDGAINSWAFGTPAKPVINSAASGVNCWVTGGLAGQYANSEASVLIGPRFDMSSLNTPIFSCSIWWESEFSWDGAVLQSSIDGGLTWQNVGGFGDPTNWYNDTTIVGLAFSGGQIGWTGRTTSGNGSGTWVTASHTLDGLGSQSSVDLRIAWGTDGSVVWEGIAFDDINVAEAPAKPFPGTGEDVELGIGINAAPSSAILLPGGWQGFTATAMPGDVLSVSVSTPNGTFTNLPLIFVGELFATGMNPFGLGPNIHFSFNAFLITAQVPFAQPHLPGGTLFNFVVPGSLAGFSLRLQDVVGSPLAANGFYASTDGYTIDFL